MGYYQTDGHMQTPMTSKDNRTRCLVASPNDEASGWQFTVNRVSNVRIDVAYCIYGAEMPVILGIVLLLYSCITISTLRHHGVLLDGGLSQMLNIRVASSEWQRVANLYLKILCIIRIFLPSLYTIVHTQAHGSPLHIATKKRKSRHIQRIYR
jgi:hypothetical protein